MPASVAPATEAAPLLGVSHVRPRAEATRLAVVKRALRAKGFSRRAATEMSHSVRRSTARVYQAKWAIFCGWCRRRSLNPLAASVPRISDFFVHLRRDKGMSVSSIKGHQAALNSVFALKGQDLASSRELRMLVVRVLSPSRLPPTSLGPLASAEAVSYTHLTLPTKA